MSGYLIYHPRRTVSKFEHFTVYHDPIGGNQDPYVWSQRFLHTYCHITQMKPEVGDINFWVSGDTFPSFDNLYCDLVFVVEEKSYWNEANSINRNDELVDSEEAFNDHYNWARQHEFKRRRRYTLKADSSKSFQPQTIDHKLIDILPFLESQGLSLDELRKSLRAGFCAKPTRISGELANQLYTWLSQTAKIKLGGLQLSEIRRSNPQLTSQK